MDVNTLNTGEKVAGASGIALLILMTFIDWFEGLNAWQAFGLIDFVLLLAAAAAIALAVFAATQSNVDLPIALSAVVTGLGALSVILIIFRIISPPDFGLDELAEAFGQDASVGRSIGVFLGLIAAAGITGGGWLAMQEEGASFTDVGGGGGGAAPPPGGGGAPPAPPQQQPPAAPPPPEQAPPAPPPPQQPPPQ